MRPRPAGWERRAEANAQELRDRQRLDTSLFRPTRVFGPSRADLDRAKAIEHKAQKGGIGRGESFFTVIAKFGNRSRAGSSHLNFLYA